MSIRIRSLRLVGITKNYEVSFLAGSHPRSLSVIAGEISTGKTSALEFIDYCLGASDHPRHQEIRRKARSAMLEIEADGAVYVIERPLFAHDRIAWVHHCSLTSIDQPHARSRKPLDPPGKEGSLSTFLLDQCGMAGILLKEAPSQDLSGADTLSFRDVMWLSFLQNWRLDNRHLMHEANFMQRLKLQQVIAVVFGVHDDQGARLGDRVRNLEERRRKLEAEIQSLEIFLSEQGVLDKAAIVTQLSELSAEESTTSAKLMELTEQMSAHTDFANELRQQHAERSGASRRAATIIRDRDTLLRRLLPLSGQYAEDERKLIFYDEARRLFDPLRVSICPSCLQSLPEPTTITDGTCSLCGQAITAEDETIDVQVELNAVRARRRAIERYIHEVEQALAEARIAYQQAASAEVNAQRQLDALVAQSIAPYISERDTLVRRHEAIRSETEMLNKLLSWLDGLDQRRLERVRLDQQVDSAKMELRELQSKRPSRDAVVAELSDRFRSILEDFGFPKLSDPEPPYLDSNFVPYVRGNIYRGIGSSGGLTLISLAWMLTLFERATELGRLHPGFLMIDSPQKNLRPSEGEPADEFRDPAIAARVWSHILRWSRGPGRNHQLVVVDNAPPREVEEAVVIRYSGRPDVPPYGLIDDETS